MPYRGSVNYGESEEERRAREERRRWLLGDETTQAQSTGATNLPPPDRTPAPQTQTRPPQWAPQNLPPNLRGTGSEQLMPERLPYVERAQRQFWAPFRAPSAWIGERLEYLRSGDPIEPVWPKLVTPGQEPTLTGRDVVTPSLGGTGDFDLVDMLLSPYHYGRIGVSGAYSSLRRAVAGDLTGAGGELLRTIGDEARFFQQHTAFAAGLGADLLLDPVTWTIPLEYGARLGAETAIKLLPRAVERPGALVEELAGPVLRGQFQSRLVRNLEDVLSTHAPADIMRSHSGALDAAGAAIDDAMGLVRGLDAESQSIIRAEVFNGLGHEWGAAWRYRLGQAGGPLDLRLTGRGYRPVTAGVGRDPLLSLQARDAMGEVAGARYTSRVETARSSWAAQAGTKPPTEEQIGEYVRQIWSDVQGVGRVPNEALPDLMALELKYWRPTEEASVGTLLPGVGQSPVTGGQPTDLGYLEGFLPDAARIAREEIGARLPSSVQRTLDEADRILRRPAVRISQRLAELTTPETPGREIMDPLAQTLVRGRAARTARAITSLEAQEIELSELIRRGTTESIRLGAEAAGVPFSMEGEALAPPEVQPPSRHPEADRIAAERLAQGPSIAPQEPPGAPATTEVAPTPTETPAAAPGAVQPQTTEQQPEPVAPAQPTGLSIMDTLAAAYPQPMHIDTVVAATGIPIGPASAELMVAMLEGRVKQVGPQRYVLTREPSGMAERRAREAAQEAAAQAQQAETVARVTAQTPQQQAILDTLTAAGGQASIDDIANGLGVPSYQVSADLMLMEIAGTVKRQPGNFYALGEAAPAKESQEVSGEVTESQEVSEPATEAAPAAPQEQAPEAEAAPEAPAAEVTQPEAAPAPPPQEAPPAPQAERPEEAAPEAERDYVEEIRDLGRQQIDLMYRSDELEGQLDEMIRSFKPIKRYTGQDYADLGSSRGELVMYMPDGRWYRFAKSAGRSPTEDDMQAMRDIVAQRDDVESQRQRLTEQVTALQDEAWGKGIDARSESARRAQLEDQARTAEESAASDRALDRASREFGGRMTRMSDFQEASGSILENGLRVAARPLSDYAQALGYRMVRRTPSERDPWVLVPSTRDEHEAARMRWPTHYDAALRVDELKWLYDEAPGDTEKAAKALGMGEDAAYVERLLSSEIAEDLGFRMGDERSEAPFGRKIIYPVNPRWPTAEQARLQASLFDAAWAEAPAPPEAQETAPAAAVSAPEAPSGVEAQPSPAEAPAGAQRVAPPEADPPQQPAPSRRPLVPPEAEPTTRAEQSPADWRWRADHAREYLDTLVHDYNEVTERLEAARIRQEALEDWAEDQSANMVAAARQAVLAEKTGSIRRRIDALMAWMESVSYWPGWTAERSHRMRTAIDRAEDVKSRYRERGVRLFSTFRKPEQRFIALLIGQMAPHRLREAMDLGDVVLAKGEEVAVPQSDLVRAVYRFLGVDPTPEQLAAGPEGLPTRGRQIWQAAARGLDFMYEAYYGRTRDGRDLYSIPSVKDLSERLAELSGEEKMAVKFMEGYWPKPRAVTSVPEYLMVYFGIMDAQGVPREVSEGIIAEIQMLHERESIQYRATYESNALRLADAAHKLSRGEDVDPDDLALLVNLDPIFDMTSYAAQVSRISLLHDIYHFVIDEFPTTEQVIAEAGEAGVAKLQAAGYRPLTIAGQPLPGLEDRLMAPQYAKVLEARLMGQLGVQAILGEQWSNAWKMVARETWSTAQVAVLITHRFLTSQVFEYIMRLLLNGVNIVSPNHARYLHVAGTVLSRALIEEADMVPARPLSFTRTAATTLGLGALGYGVGSLIGPSAAEVLGTMGAAAGAMAPFAMRARVAMSRAHEAVAQRLRRDGIPKERVELYFREVVEDRLVIAGFGVQSTEQLVSLFRHLPLSTEDIAVLVAQRAMLGERATRVASEIGHDLGLAQAELRDLTEAVAEVFFGIDNLHGLVSYIARRERGETREEARKGVRENRVELSVGGGDPIGDFLKHILWFSTFWWQTGRTLARAATRRPGWALTIAEMWRRRHEFNGFDAEAQQIFGGMESWRLTSPEWAAIPWRNYMLPPGSAPGPLILKHMGPAVAFVRLRIPFVEEPGVWAELAIDPVRWITGNLVPGARMLTEASQSYGMKDIGNATPVIGTYVSGSRRVPGSPLDLNSPWAKAARGQQVSNDELFRYVEPQRTAAEAERIAQLPGDQRATAWADFRRRRQCPRECHAPRSLWQKQPQEAAALELQLMRMYYNLHLAQTTTGLTFDVEFTRDELQRMNLNQLYRGQAEARAKMEDGVRPYIMPDGDYPYTYQGEIDQRLLPRPKGPVTPADQVGLLWTRMRFSKPAAWAGAPEE